MMRLPAAQRWPASMKADAVACLAATSQVGVVAHDERILAAELQTDFREHRAAADLLLNQLAGRNRPGEADEAHARILDERHADFGAEPLNGRVHARREACFAQQLAERDRRVRRQLVRFRHDGVATHERGKRLPRDAGKRAVERHHRGADADRGALGADASIRDRARRRLAVEAAAFAAHEHRKVGRRFDFGDGVLPRLPRFDLHDIAEVPLGCAQQRGGAADNLAPLRRRQTAPSFGRAQRGADRDVHVRGGPSSDARDNPVVHRTALLEGAVARGRHLGVVYPVENRVGYIVSDSGETTRALRAGARGVAAGAACCGGDAVRVEAVIREDFRIAAADWRVGEADGADLRAHACARDGRRDHHPLTERDVMVVERDDRGEA